MNENDFVEMIMTGNLNKCISNYKTQIVNYNLHRICTLLQQNNIEFYSNSDKYLQKKNSKYEKLYLDSKNIIFNLLNVNIYTNKYDLELEQAQSQAQETIKNNINNLYILLNLLLQNGYRINFIYKKLNTTLVRYIQSMNTNNIYKFKTKLQTLKTLELVESIEIIVNYIFNEDESSFIVEARNIPIIISLD